MTRDGDAPQEAALRPYGGWRGQRGPGGDSGHSPRKVSLTPPSLPESPVLRAAQTHHTGHPKTRRGRWWHRATHRTPSTPKREGGAAEGGLVLQPHRAGAVSPPPLITCLISTLITQGNALIKEKGFSLSPSLSFPESLVPTLPLAR